MKAQSKITIFFKDGSRAVFINYRGYTTSIPGVFVVRLPCPAGKTQIQKFYNWSDIHLIDIETPDA